MSYGWALNQYDSCPTQTEREDHTKTQEKTAVYKPKTRGLRRNQYGSHLDVKYPGSRIKRIKYLLFTPPTP